MISLFRLDGTPLYRNPAARASAHLFNEPLLARFAEPDACRRLLNEVAQRGEARSILPMHTVAGPRWHDITARLQRDAATGDVSVLVSEIDVTRQKEDEARAIFLSAHDVLTGLCNRDTLRRRFDELMAQGHGSSGLQAALILVDLDRFKDVNDAMGHAAGDELLVQVAARLRQAIRSGDLVARYGGDEFLILLHGPSLQSVVRCIDHRIRQVIDPPVLIDDVPVYVSATIGVSLCPDDGHDFDTLLCRADMAMHAAKTGGPNTLAFYEPHMGSELSARTTLEADLRRALAAQEFVLYYQPRVALPSQRIVGAEALLRWEHPTRGLVPPLEFIPVCEAIGLIHELGRQVFKMAAHQQAQWRQRGLHLTLSVNLSPREFDAPDLLASLELSIADAGCPPEALQLEITESMLMRADDRPLRTLCALRSLGLSIALDDFGTGYSNLAYLQRFPFDVLKIDRTFVQAHPQDRPLAEAIALMGRTLRLAVVAEGVETEEQLAWLSRLGVNEYQGFLFSRPLPADAFQALLAHHGHNTA